MILFPETLFVQRWIELECAHSARMAGYSLHTDSRDITNFEKFINILKVEGISHKPCPHTAPFEVYVDDQLHEFVKGSPVGIRVFSKKMPLAKEQLYFYQFREKNRIIQQPGVCNGRAYVAKTEVPVWEIERARRGGCKIKEILELFPALSSEDCNAAWDYVSWYPLEISEQIKLGK